MFRITRIYDDNLQINKLAIKDIQKIIEDQFPDLSKDEILRIPNKLRNPLKYQFKTIIFLADNIKGEVKGFAILMYAPDLHFCFLDYISTSKKYSGKGIGGALYEKIRNEAYTLNSKALFFECLPDEANLCKDPIILKQNKQRLKFYEQYGARPLINTKYETPIKEDGDNPPYLVVDYLDSDLELTSEEVKNIVSAVLNRKYSKICNQDYIRMVVDSISDSPIKLRPFRYFTSKHPYKNLKKNLPEDRRIKIAVNDRHTLHHIKERGYVESPVRQENILKALDCTGLFTQIKVKHFNEKYITSVHSRGLYEYISSVVKNIPTNKSVYPYVFPVRNKVKRPIDLTVQAGYYCIDTFTPLNKNAYTAARRAVDAALTCAHALIVDEAHISYALVRPPGHHAETNSFGGFCYFNSNAIAAEYLSKHGKVAILDIDYHHGNGQQEIFYQRNDVFTQSIHGDPRIAYPYFCGYKNEIGENAGRNFNMNYPLPEHIDFFLYLETLHKALKKIKQFNPLFLVIALGLDTAKGDPTGTWNLTPDNFYEIGALVGKLRLKTVVIQEGGYRTKTIGQNAYSFFKGLWEYSLLNSKCSLDKRIK